MTQFWVVKAQESETTLPLPPPQKKSWVQGGGRRAGPSQGLPGPNHVLRLADIRLPARPALEPGAFAIRDGECSVSEFSTEAPSRPLAKRAALTRLSLWESSGLLPAKEHRDHRGLWCVVFLQLI